MIGLIVLTLGTFDCFHAGHARLLHRAAALGPLHVGVNSDVFVRSYKGRLPEQSQSYRMWMLEQLKGVEEVHLNDGPGRALIHDLKPSLLVVGSDWYTNEYFKQIDSNPYELFGNLDCGLVFFPRTPGVSSSGLRR